MQLFNHCAVYDFIPSGGVNNGVSARVFLEMTECVCVFLTVVEIVRGGVKFKYFPHTPQTHATWIPLSSIVWMRTARTKHVDTLYGFRGKSFHLI